MTKKTDLEKLDQNLGEIEEKTRTIQQRANETTQFVANSRKQVQFLGSEFPKYEAVAEAAPEFKERLPKDYRWVQQALKDSENALAGLAQAKRELDQSANYAMTAVSTVTSVGYSMISAVHWMDQQYPESGLFRTYRLQDPKVFRESTTSDILGRLLSEYDPDLERDRKGAWQAFHSGFDAKDSQSAHSMRDIIRKFILKHASNEIVKTAAWWTEAKDTDDGVSTRQRLRFLAYGPTAEANETELDFIQQQLDEFFRSYYLLSKAAHGSEQATAAIEASMKSAEHLLLLILNRRALTDAPPKKFYARVVPG